MSTTYKGYQVTCELEISEPGRYTAEAFDDTGKSVACEFAALTPGRAIDGVKSKINKLEEERADWQEWNELERLQMATDTGIFGPDATYLD